MRHLKKRTLGKKRDVNRRLLRQLSNSLILHERIETTEKLGKFVRSHVEKLITKGKNDTIHAKRQLFSDLNDNAARKVFEVISPKYKDRAGGYTRILRVPAGKDGMPRVIVEFINGEKPGKKETAKKAGKKVASSATRREGGKSEEKVKA